MLRYVQLNPFANLEGEVIYVMVRVKVPAAGKMCLSYRAFRNRDGSLHRHAVLVATFAKIQFRRRVVKSWAMFSPRNDGDAAESILPRGHLE